MSNDKNKQQNPFKENKSKNVPVAGDLNVSAECLEKSVGTTEEVTK